MSREPERKSERSTDGIEVYIKQIFALRPSPSLFGHPDLILFKHKQGKKIILFLCRKDLQEVG